jgi:hypothetical protein
MTSEECCLSDPSVSSNKSIDLGALATKCLSLTPAVCDYYAEAAAYCLNDQHHSNGVELKIAGSIQATANLNWPPLHASSENSYADSEEATEYGATGIALHIVLSYTEWSHIERSCKNGGFDYWLGDGADSSMLFQNKCRMEVSGILHGTNSQIRSRLSSKIDRLSKYKSPLPLIVIVVEFGKPQAEISIKP